LNFLIKYSDIIFIVFGFFSLVATITIAAATITYAIFTKKNIKELQEQNKLLNKQLGYSNKNLHIVLTNLLFKDKQSIRDIYNIIKMEHLLRLANDTKIRTPNFINKALEGFKYLVSCFQKIDLLLASSKEKDLGTFYIELFGYTEGDSAFYFGTLINAFEFFKNQFKPEDKVLIKKLFRRISEERNYKDLTKLIDNSK